jgi:hypothetical protein
MAKKARTVKVYTSRQILDDWKKALQKGLGTKKLDPIIVTNFTPLLLAKIEERLKAGGDYSKEGAATRKVGTDLGKICKMLTAGSKVSLAVFEQSFKLCKLHPTCPAGGGSGRWCDV